MIQRKPKSFSLSEECVSLLRKLADKHHRSMSMHLEHLIFESVNQPVRKPKRINAITKARNLHAEISQMQVSEQIKEEFYAYWNEKSPNGKKARWEMEKVFDTKRRMQTWLRNSIRNVKDKSADW